MNGIQEVSGSIPLISTKTDHKAKALWSCSTQKKNEESDTWIERPWANFKSEVHPGPFSLLGADQRRCRHLRPGWQWQPDKLSRLSRSGEVRCYSINFKFGCSEINMKRHSTFRQIVVS